MNKIDLQNSIFLIGPTCVGKSLLSKELGNKLNMSVISIDDLIMFVQYENEGYLSPSVKKQNEFINLCIRDIKKDKVLSKNLKDKSLADKEAQLVLDFVNNYRRYVEMFGSLKPFHKLIKDYDKVKDNYEKDIEWISCYSSVSTIMILKIIEMLKYPVIFDTPAMFGWKLDENKINKKYRDYLLNGPLKINISQIEKHQNRLLRNSKTVFLEPGLDYPIRNSAKNISGNKLLLKHLDNYFDYANISITTNAMFNQPENKYFMKRSWFDAKEYETKEKLKNKCNISNICDEIISMINGLNDDLKL